MNFIKARLLYNHTPHVHAVHIPHHVINANCTQAPLTESPYMGCNYINYTGCILRRSYQTDSGEVTWAHVILNKRLNKVRCGQRAMKTNSPLTM